MLLVWRAKKVRLAWRSVNCHASRLAPRASRLAPRASRLAVCLAEAAEFGLVHSARKPLVSVAARATWGTFL